MPLSWPCFGLEVVIIKKIILKIIAWLLIILIVASPLFIIIYSLLPVNNVKAAQTPHYVMTSSEFCNRCLDVAENKKTLYVMGGYGQPLNEKGKQYSYNSYEYNRRADRAPLIAAADENTFGFDCVCFIKSILWGFNADNTKDFGGAVYGSNGVYDVNCEGLIDMCPDKSNDFSDIEAGEVLYMSGHVGMYAGNGIVVECTPRWGNGVKKTMLGNLPEYRTGNYRMWLYHGHLPYIDYSGEPVEPEKPEKPETPEHSNENMQKMADIVYNIHKELDELALLIAEEGGGAG